MEKLIQVGLLSLGGVFGVNARYWLGLCISRWSGQQFPWATLLINVTGSFAIGFCTMLLSRWLPNPNVRLLLVTGFLGGYTTYSTFAFESLALWERGDRIQGTLYMGTTLAGGFLAVALGAALARGLTLPAHERASPGQPPPLAPSEPGAPINADDPREAP